jgi:hypothetical protein
VFPDIQSSSWKEGVSAEVLQTVAEKYVDSLSVGNAENERDAQDRHLYFFPTQEHSSNSIATRSLLELIHAAFYFLDCIKINDAYGIFRYVKYSTPVFLAEGGAGYAGEMVRYAASVVAGTSEKDSCRLFFNGVGNTTGFFFVFF